MSVHAGPGSCARLGGILARLGARSVFLVTGRASYATSGAEAALAPALGEKRVVRFCEFTPNPTANEVEGGVRLFRGAPCDTVVAVGGGSVLDMAKLVNTCAASDGDVPEQLRNEVALARGVPLVAIPTTAGSGAEATHFATVYVEGEKYSTVDGGMRPTHAILDAELTASLPPALTASTGIDALAQGIESYWSVRADEQSLADAREAVRLAMHSLVAATCNPSDESRLDMLEAAHRAGCAIDRSRTTAPHALSYALTRGFGIPHGHAVGLTLGAFFAWNARTREGDLSDPRGPEWVGARIAELCRLLDSANGEAARATLDRLMAKLGLETRLRALGVSRGDLPALARSVNEERLANNPRRLPPEAVGRVLESVY